MSAPLSSCPVGQGTLEVPPAMPSTDLELDRERALLTLLRSESKLKVPHMKL